MAGEDEAGYHLTARVKVTDYRCIEEATMAFHSQCLNLGRESWVLQHTMSFVSLCESGYGANALVKSIAMHC